MNLLTKYLMKRLSTRQHIMSLDPKSKERLLNDIIAPKQLNIHGSLLKFYIHSPTENGRVQKFKETWTIEWLRNIPKNSVLYDVGANIGITTLIPLENQDLNIQVVAIEPAPINFASLTKNIQLNGFSNRVYALPVGLGSSTDVAEFKLTTTVAGGAMHSFGDIVVNSTYKTHGVVATHFCQRTKLDDLVNWKGLPFPTHIKIDIDGGEVELLQGASNVLSDPRCIAAQIEVVDADNNHLRSKEVIDLMSNAGFRVTGSFPHGKTYPQGIDIQFTKTARS